MTPYGSEIVLWKEDFKSIDTFELWCLKKTRDNNMDNQENKQIDQTCVFFI